MNSSYMDEQVFKPLTDYLCTSPFDEGRLERAVQQIGMPDRLLIEPSDFKGFALEVYFKVMLADFMQEKCPQLNGLPVSDGYYSGLRVTTDRWGTVLVQSAKSSPCAEFDSLCEYQTDRETIPVLFETTFRGSGGGLWNRKLPFLARLLNGKRTYLCKVRPAKPDESPALYVRNGKRKILVPYLTEIERFGQILFPVKIEN